MFSIVWGHTPGSYSWLAGSLAPWRRYSVESQRDAAVVCDVIVVCVVKALLEADTEKRLNLDGCRRHEWLVPEEEEEAEITKVRTNTYGGAHQE